MGSFEEPEKEPTEKRAYEKPEIIYESVISTRAGSPIIGGDNQGPPVERETIDLFPE